MTWRSVLLSVLAFSALGVASMRAGDDQGPDATALRAEYDQVLLEWKELLKGLAVIKMEFQSANEADQAKLREEFGLLRTKSVELEPRLITAAETLYAAGDRGDEAMVRLLAVSLRQRISQDDYEAAFRLGRNLIEARADMPYLKLLTGVAAFGSNEFDIAAEYLRGAQEAGQIAKMAKDGGEIGKQVAETAFVALSNLDDTKSFWNREKKIRQAEAQADDLPRVKFQTSQGDIVIELFENEAPGTTANFIDLVENEFYDGLKFHRVLAGFMAQGGCPLGTGSGGPGYHIPCECYQDNFRRHFRGSLSMAHAGRDTGGSQFFLTFRATSHLDGKHTVFGRVIDGMEVLAKIRRRESTDAGPADQIQKASVLRKRSHEYKPKKVGS